jgi:hypothetical protein
VRRSLAFLVLALLLRSRTAAASPFGDPAVERGVFAGSTVAHPWSLLLNPASLAFSTGSHVHVSGSTTLDRVTIDRRTIDPATEDLADGPSASAKTWGPGGSLGAYTVSASGRFAAGFQFALPSPEEMIDGGDALAYHARGGRHRELVWAAGGAYRWRGFAFGASAQLVWSELTLRFARDTALEAGRGDVIEGTGCDGGPCGLENPLAREDYRIDTRSTRLPSARNTVAATIGMVARLAEGWWLGVAYHSPPGLFSSIETTGTVEVTRAPRDGGDTVQGEAVVRLNLPQRLRIGVRGRITERLDLVAEARWEQLSSLRNYDVRLLGLALEDAGVPELHVRPRGLRDQLAAQVGVEQVDTGQRFVLGARLGGERGATADDRLSALNAYPAALTADVGVQVRLAPSWILQLGYGVGWSPPADTGRGAYDPIDRLDCIDSGFDVDDPACLAVRDGYAQPTASGSYGRVDNVFRVSLRWAVR